MPIRRSLRATMEMFMDPYPQIVCWKHHERHTWVCSRQSAALFSRNMQ